MCHIKEQRICISDKKIHVEIDPLDIIRHFISVNMSKEIYDNCNIQAQYDCNLELGKIPELINILEH